MVNSSKVVLVDDVLQTLTKKRKKWISEKNHQNKLWRKKLWISELLWACFLCLSYKKLLWQISFNKSATQFVSKMKTTVILGKTNKKWTQLSLHYGNIGSTGSSTTKWTKLNCYCVFFMHVRFCVKVVLKSWDRIILGTIISFHEILTVGPSIGPDVSHPKFQSFF